MDRWNGACAPYSCRMHEQGISYRRPICHLTELRVQTLRNLMHDRGLVYETIFKILLTHGIIFKEPLRQLVYDRGDWLGRRILCGWQLRALRQLLSSAGQLE